MKKSRLTALFERPVAWLGADAAEPFVLVSTRIRLARNLAHLPFPGKATIGQRQQVFAQVTANLPPLCTKESGTGGDWLPAEMPYIPEAERRLLVERRLASRELSQMGIGSGVVLAPDESVAIMVNEEDHFRIHSLRPGFDLETAFTTADRLESELEARFGFAFDRELGFLTACPSNVGTGLRASVMLHLPALALAGQLEPVIRAAREIRFTVRGFFGEGTEATGNFFQVSNQTTLGESEEEILVRLQRVVGRIVNHELALRQRLATERQAVLLDHIGRSYGTLKYAHVLSTKDALNHLSMVLLGRDLGVLPLTRSRKLQELVVKVQPAHLQKLARQELDGRARGIERARLLRAVLQA